MRAAAVLALLVLLFLAASCGGSAPDVLGTWSGTISDVLSCPGSSPQTSSVADYQVLVSQAGVTFGGCNDVISATVSDTTAVLKMHKCTPITVSDGSVVTTTVIGGTLSASGNTLTVSVQESADVSVSGMDNLCNATLTGTLLRQ
jgi:hypothetical protein